MCSTKKHITAKELIEFLRKCHPEAVITYDDGSVLPVYLSEAKLNEYHPAKDSEIVLS